eukprot:3900092-Rhodomonas_salina.2
MSVVWGGEATIPRHCPLSRGRCRSPDSTWASQGRLRGYTINTVESTDCWHQGSRLQFLPLE